MTEVSEKVRAEAKEMFAMFDKDGNGKISSSELETVMRGLNQNPTDDEVGVMLKELDTDNNGTVDFEEFLTWFSGKQKSKDQVEEELAEAFQQMLKFDKNGDGKVSKEELKKTLEELEIDCSDLEEMFKEADKNNDGTIDVKELAKMMV